MPIYYIQYPRHPFTASCDTAAFQEVSIDIDSLLREDDTCDGTRIHRVYRLPITSVTPATDSGDT